MAAAERPGLRVTIATYDDVPPIGGQGVVVGGMRAALRARGVTVRTVAGHGAAAIAVPRVTGRAPLDLSLGLSRDPAVLLAGGTDVVHAMGGPGGVLLLRRLPVPVVYTAHHTYRQAYAARSPRRLLGVAERSAYGRAARVLCVSPSTASAVRALGVDAARVEVVPSGIDADRLAAVAAAAPVEPGRLLFVGRLEPEKGPLDAVAVMAALAARDARVRGVVVGRGSLDGAVRAAAGRVGGGGVAVLGGVDDDVLAEELARAAVVLVPSAYEGLGLVALEAAAAGAAVCGYDVTGLRDAVPAASILVRPGDVAALVSATAALLTDEPRRAALAAAGAAHVRAHHAWAVSAARIEAVYREVLAGG